MKRVAMIAVLLACLSPVPAAAYGGWGMYQPSDTGHRWRTHMDPFRAPARRLPVRNAGCAGEVRSKAGASACVSPKYAGAFQAFVADLEAHGAVIKFMGGYRNGTCGQANKHACGMAIDVCQLARGVVAHGQMWGRRQLPDCRLPGKTEISAIAKAHGLFSGGDWCRPDDYGHIEAGGSAACGGSWARVVHRRRARQFGYADAE